MYHIYIIWEKFIGSPSCLCSCMSSPLPPFFLVEEVRGAQGSSFFSFLQSFGSTVYHSRSPIKNAYFPLESGKYLRWQADIYHHYSTSSSSEPSIADGYPCTVLLLLLPSPPSPSRRRRQNQVSTDI